MVGILPVRTMAWVQALNFPVSPTTACNDWQHLKRQSFSTASFGFSAVQRQPEGQHFPSHAGNSLALFPKVWCRRQPILGPPKSESQLVAQGSNGRWTTAICLLHEGPTGLQSLQAAFENPVVPSWIFRHQKYPGLINKYSVQCMAVPRVTALCFECPEHQWCLLGSWLSWI